MLAILKFFIQQVSIESLFYFRYKARTYEIGTEQDGQKWSSWASGKY